MALSWLTMDGAAKREFAAELETAVLVKDAMTRHVSLACPECRQWMQIKRLDFDDVVANIRIRLERLRTLTCENCGDAYLSGHAQSLLRGLARQAKERDADRVNATPREDAADRRFPIAENIEFLYDATDYDYIPGLTRPWKQDDGYLVPVFFKREVLLKYLHHPDYTLEFGGNTYGGIYRGSDHMIAFGLNRRGIVIAWLGDLATLPEADQHHFRSENVPSDHDIGSEFYEGQILARFGEASRERRLFSTRETLTRNCLQNRGASLHRYDEEVLDVVAQIKPPLIWTDAGVSPCIQALNKVASESLNTEWLRTQIREADAGARIKGLGSLKLLEVWLNRVLGEPADHAAELTLPFFVLYDFRVSVAHLIPKEKATETMVSCKDRLGLDAEASLQETYEALVDRLVGSYEAIARLV